MTLANVIGRRIEHELASRYMARAREGGGYAILLTGDPGMGKTTLIDSLAQAHPDAVYAKYVCRREETNKPFRPMMAILESYKVNHPPVRPFASELKTALEERRERSEPIKDTLAFLENAGKVGPLLIFFENIHLADTDTLRLLRELSDHISHLRVLLAFAYPTGEITQVEGTPLADLLAALLLRDRLVALRLEPMGLEDTREMLKSFLDVREIPEAFVKKVQSETDGNPFFVKELIGNLLACGSIRKGDASSLEKADLSKVQVPDNMDQMIQNRLASLPDEDLMLLQAASVLGLEFRIEDLSDLSGVPLDAVIDRLDSLTRAGMLSRSEHAQNSFRFDHPKAHDLIYSMLGQEKRDWHLKAAVMMERKGSDQADTVFNLAYHFSRSRDIDKAILYTLKAARKAISANAPRSALKYAESAMRLLEGADVNEETIKRFVEAEELMADLYYALNRWDESADKYATLLEAAKQTGDRRVEARALLGLSEVAKNKGNWQRSHEHSANALKVSKDVGYQRGVAKALQNLGYVNWRLGNYEQAQEYYNRCIAAAAAEKDMETMGIVYIEIGNLTSVRGKLDEAANIYRKSIKILEGLRNMKELARAYNNLGDIYLQKEDWAGALQQFERSREHAERGSDRNMLAWALLNAGEALANLNELDRAIESCLRSVEILKETGDKSGISGAFRTLGIAYGLKGDWDSAMNYFNQAIEINKETKTPDTLADTYCVIGKLLLQKGDHDLGIEFLDRGLKISEKIGAVKITERINNLKSGLAQ